MGDLGRPSIFSNEFTSKAKEYLEGCEDETENVVSGESDKWTSYKQKTKVKLPSIEGLAHYLGIHKDTIYEWEKIHPDFSDVINMLRAKQAERLVNNGLSGDYNPIIAKLLLAKHGYVERNEITGADGTNLLPINIILPPGE